ncbi:MAG: hydantoinase B/oxoprolinase family protein [Rhodospirillaceae bacterium]|nr:hydantoinase B/oxoprolinase family protein [Rhodospirillaceae bacterium]MBT5675927.1 hydantoinase B/oxoprolinase family protein [Rhodospirillaceae bacterium]MBT5780852.1 hydantoinase B/oxoprolinase family protein [Rhodospirillaceae bacterium]
MTEANKPSASQLDSVLISILANRLDGIVREMSNTLLRAARSAVIAAARDFSCAICTGDNRLLSAAEGLPVHIFGSHLQTQAMCDLHDDLAEGDAFLHNDSYLGNTHSADLTVLVPVFIDGEHMFTACAKAHQADIGNSIPTTYHAAARDVYEEGAMIFPCVRVQANYEMNDDIIRMCRRRIRVPEQWYGDFLAALGSARIAERRLKELCAKYGKDQIKQFIEEWFDYSERMMVQAIRELPKAKIVNEGAHDPFEPILPDGIPIKVELDLDPDKAIIEIDLRDNIDCVDCGLNQSEACAINNVVAGVFHSLEGDLPHNAGSFRRIVVHLRDGCVVGRPSFPHSASMATTNVADRLVNLTQSAFAQLGDGHGLAEGGSAMAAGFAVVSGNDFRRNGEPYINQLMTAVNGGPASPQADGWVTYGLPVVAGLMYRDSVELDEIKHPMHFDSLRLMPATGGAGRFRGGPATEVVYGPREDPMTVVIPSDCQINPARGVRGGLDGAPAAQWKVSANGDETKLPNVVQVELQPGEFVRGFEAGGGGYGSPFERPPERVLKDVERRWETVERARDIYGVVLSGSLESDDLAIDAAATEAARASA